MLEPTLRSGKEKTGVMGSQQSGEAAVCRRCVKEEEGLETPEVGVCPYSQDCVGSVCSLQFLSSASHSFRVQVLPPSIGLFLGILFIFMQW